MHPFHLEYLPSHLWTEGARNKRLRMYIFEFYAHRVTTSYACMRVVFAANVFASSFERHRDSPVAVLSC